MMETKWLATMAPLGALSLGGIAREWMRHLNSMYMFMIDTSREIDTTWSDAAFACKSQGGRLVSIDSRAEWTYLSGRIQELVESQGQQFAFEQWWTAGKQREDHWLWEQDDGKDHLVTLPVGRGHHDPSQKVSLGLVHDQDGWALKPIPSTYRLRYICERDAVPEILLSQPPEERLLGALFRKYDRDARGMRSGHGTFQVTASMAVTQLHVLAEIETFLTSSGIISLTWSDERLTWIPGQYENVTHVVMSAARIWLPPLDIVNSLPDWPVFPQEDTRLFLSYQGHVLWERPFTSRTPCHTDNTLFPWDSCDCALIMRSSGYPASFLNLSIDQTSLSINSSRHAGAWRLRGQKLDRELYKPLQLKPGPVSHYQTRIVFHFQRQARFYVIAYIVPSIITSLLMVLTFLIPAGESERVTSSVLVYLCYTLLAAVIANAVYVDSRHVPILASHVLVTVLLLSGSLAFSWFTYRLYHKSLDSPFPACMLGLAVRRRRQTKLKESPSKEIQLASLSSLKKDPDECLKDMERRASAHAQKPYSRVLESSPFAPDLATPCGEEERHQFINPYRNYRDSRSDTENHWQNLSERLNRTFAVILGVLLLINIIHLFVKCAYSS